MPTAEELEELDWALSRQSHVRRHPITVMGPRIPIGFRYDASRYTDIEDPEELRKKIKDAADKGITRMGPL